MKIIILCGGSGSRLWPLSRTNHPKQFLKLYNDLSLLQQTYARAKRLAEPKDIFFVTNFKNYYTVINQIREIEPEMEPSHVLHEPERRDTAPAIFYAVAAMDAEGSLKDDEPILVAPSDHFVGDEEAYVALMRRAAAMTTDAIVTVGIQPTGPNTGYGYIQKGAELEPGCFQVERFKEKPDTTTAKAYLQTGDYLWNSGMYLFTRKTLLRELQRHSPETAALMTKGYEAMKTHFKELPALSFDYAVAEKSNDLRVFEGSFGWNDVGSFDAVIEMKNGNGTGNGKSAGTKHVGIDSNNVHVFGTKSRLVATLGVSDLIVVENNDSTMICKRGDSEGVKKLVQFLEANNHPEVEGDIEVHRPWGSYEVLLDTPTYKVKKLIVYPGAKLSLQTHSRRSEHWVVVRGTADVVNGPSHYQLNANESAYIPKGAQHQLANSNGVNLEIIEVQTGDYLGEDDIVRHEDVYNRS